MNKKVVMVIALCTHFFIGAMKSEEEKVQKNNVLDVPVIRLMQEHLPAEKIKFSHHNTKLIQLYLAGDNDYIVVKKQILAKL